MQASSFNLGDRWVRVFGTYHSVESWRRSVSALHVSGADADSTRVQGALDRCTAKSDILYFGGTEKPSNVLIERQYSSRQ